MIYGVGRSVIRLGLTVISANTKHMYNIYIMLDQRRRNVLCLLGCLYNCNAYCDGCRNNFQFYLLYFYLILKINVQNIQN